MLDVRQYQLVREPDFLRVRIVTRDSAPDNLSARIRDAIAHQLAEAGAAPTRILVEQVDELERDPGHASKLKLVTSA